MFSYFSIPNFILLIHINVLSKNGLKNRDEEEQIVEARRIGNI